MCFGILSLQHADDQDLRAGGAELLDDGRGRPLGSLQVLGPVQDDQRVTADDLEAARGAHRGGRLADQPVVEGTAEEGLGRRHRRGEVLALVARRADPATRPRSVAARGPQVEHPPADRQVVAGALDSPGRPTTARRAAPARRSGAARGPAPRGPGWQPGLMMPAFSPAMSARVGPRNSTWSSPTLVTTATWRRPRWWRPSGRPGPTSKTATSTGRSANQRQRRPGEDLEPGQPDVVAEQRLDPGQVGEDLGQVGVADRLAVGGDPLVDPLQVGAGEGAHPSGPWPSAGR